MTVYCDMYMKSYVYVLDLLAVLLSYCTKADLILIVFRVRNTLTGLWIWQYCAWVSDDMLWDTGMYWKIKLGIVWEFDTSFIYNIRWMRIITPQQTAVTQRFIELLNNKENMNAPYSWSFGRYFLIITFASKLARTNLVAMLFKTKISSVIYTHKIYRRRIPGMVLVFGLINESFLGKKEPGVPRNIKDSKSYIIFIAHMWLERTLLLYITDTSSPFY